MVVFLFFNWLLNMATARKSAKDENVKKLTKDKFAKIKYLSTWLFKPSLSMEFLIEDKNEFNSGLKYRLFSYFLNNPKVCWYLNTYLNGFYDFTSTYYSPKDWLLMFAEIIRMYKIKSLWITKFQSLKRDQFTKLMDTYFKQMGEMELNNSEINNLYLLFEYNIIKQDDVEILQITLSDKGETKTKSSNQQQTVVNREPIKTSPEVVDFCNRVVNGIQHRQHCKFCPGYRKANLVLEAQKYTDIDILVLGLYPETSDLRSQEFLSEHSIFKTNLNELFKKYNLNYAYSNRILCEASNTDATNIKRMYDNCTGQSTFVHDVAQPKLKIILGSKYAKLLGVKSFNKQMGMSILGGEAFLLPDPAELDLSKDKDFELISACFDNLNEFIKNKSRSWKNGDSTFDTTTIENQLVTKTNNNYTLFDIQVINGNIIYTVLDENNEKQYITNNNISYPVFIKSGKFNECNFIDDQPDFIAHLSIFEKQILSQKLNDNLKRKILKSNMNNGIEEPEDNQPFDDEMF
jgi:hypothetical protein